MANTKDEPRFEINLHFILGILKSGFSGVLESRKDSKPFVKNTLWVALSFAAYNFSGLIAPFFISRISIEHLNSYVLLMYSSYFGVALYAAFGLPMFHLVNFQKEKEEVQLAFGSVLTLTLVVAIVGSIVLALLQNPILSKLRIAERPNIHAAYFVVLFYAAHFAILNMLSFAIVSMQKAKVLLILDICVVTISAAICLVVSHSNLSADDKFLGIVAAQPAADLVYAAGYIFILRKYIRLGFSRFTDTWRRYKEYTPSYLKDWASESMTPLFVSAFFAWSNKSSIAESVAAFNIGRSVFNLLYVPSSALSTTAPTWSAQSLKFRKPTLEYVQKMKVIFGLTIFISLTSIFAFSPFAKVISAEVFELSENTSFLVLLMAILSLLPEGLVACLANHLNACERHRELAKVKMLVSIGTIVIVAPMSLLFKLNTISAGIVFIVAPLIKLFWLYKTANSEVEDSDFTRSSSPAPWNLEVQFEEPDRRKLFNGAKIFAINPNGVTLLARNILEKDSLKRIFKGKFVFAGLAEIPFVARIENGAALPVRNKPYVAQYEMSFVELSDEDRKIISDLVSRATLNSSRNI